LAPSGVVLDPSLEEGQLNAEELVGLSLDKIIVGAGGDGLVNVLHSAAGGEDDDDAPRAFGAGAETATEFRPLEVRQGQIHDGQLHRGVPEGGEGVALLRTTNDFVPAGMKTLLEPVPLGVIRRDEHNAHRLLFSLCVASEVA
jgi:hypothetical protein